MRHEAREIDEAGSGRRAGHWAIAAAVVLAAGAGIGWAGATVITPAEDVLGSSAHTYVEIVQGEVGSSINLNSVAEWEPIPIGSNQAAGVVTKVRVNAGDEVSAGSILYDVNARPVVIAQGSVPAYRSIDGRSKGADVSQLQKLLAKLDHYHGATDGIAGPQTLRAIKAWQKSLGLDETGIVEMADVVFVPDLPIRVALDQEVIKRGAALSGAEAVVTGLPASPKFSVPITDKQAGLMPAGTRVEITSPKGEVWASVVADQGSGEDGTVVVELAGANGESICGRSCGDVPVTGRSLLSSRIVTVETARGAVVPAAALLTNADGSVFVIDRKGVKHRVKVVTSARGMSVIEGARIGLHVQVPAASEGS